MFCVRERLASSAWDLIISFIVVDMFYEVDNSWWIAVFVVVPYEQLDKVATDNLDGLGIKDGRVRIVGNVAADDGFLGIFEVRFQLTIGVA